MRHCILTSAELSFHNVIKPTHVYRINNRRLRVVKALRSSDFISIESRHDVERFDNYGPFILCAEGCSILKGLDSLTLLPPGRNMSRLHRLKGETSMREQWLLLVTPLKRQKITLSSRLCEKTLPFCSRENKTDIVLHLTMGKP
jgi:hypothetical protein